MRPRKISRIRHRFQKGAAVRVIFIAVLASFYLVATVEAAGTEIIVGYPEFQNPVYTEEPNHPNGDPRRISRYDYGAVSFFNGHGVPFDEAEAVTNGTDILIRSGFGHPFGTFTRVEPNLLLGELIKIPHCVSIPSSVDLEAVAASAEPPKKVFYIGPDGSGFEGGIYAGEPGFVSLDWGEECDKQDGEYFIGTEAYKQTVMKVFHTEGISNAPVIELGSLSVEPHYNSIITEDSFWLDDLNNIHAQDAEGFIVLEVRIAGRFAGFQVVEVRNILQAKLGSYFLGQELFPEEPLATTEYTDGVLPRVTAGGRAGMTPIYIYEHNESELESSDHYGRIFAVRKTTIEPELNPEMEVYWMRTSDALFDTDGDGEQDAEGLGIEWPFELTRYSTSWPEDFPDYYQVYARGADGEPEAGPGISVDQALNPDVMPYRTPGNLAITDEPSNGGVFRVGALDSQSRNNWALLRYRPGDPLGFDGIGFQVVRCVAHDANEPGFELTEVPRPVGAEITYDYHDAVAPGYIHIAQQPSEAIREDRYDWAVYDGESGGTATSSITPTGQVIPVNTGDLEVWWYNTDDNGIEWPSKVARYRSVWPGDAEALVISRQDGVAPPAVGATSIYYQNEPGLRGFNPNDEHVFEGEDANGARFYALRDDLGLSPGSTAVSDEKSAPYALLRYRDGDAWRHTVYQVTATDADHPFSDWAESVDDPVTDPYEVQITGFEDGRLGPQGPINAPIPIQQFLPNWVDENYFVDFPCDRGTADCPPIFLARDGRYYPLGAGIDGVSTEEVTARFHYPLDDRYGFYFPPDYASRAGLDENPADGDVVPWLNLRDGNPDEPTDVILSIYWPEDPGELQVGDTLFEARNGLPAADGQCSTEVIYQQMLEDGTVGRESVALIDPFAERTAPLAVEDFPFGEIRVDQVGSSYVLSDLSPGLSSRIRYDAAAEVLRLTGRLVNPATGPSYLQLNVLTERDLDELLHLGPNGAAVESTEYETAVTALFGTLVADERAPHGPVEIDGEATEIEHDQGVAITAGFAQAPGFVTIAFGNNEDCASDGPVGVYTFRVTETPWQGRLVAVEPDCVFQEQLTLQHVGDFGGTAGEYEFQWLTSQPVDGGRPELPAVDANGDITDFRTWSELDPSELKALDDEQPERVGANSITVSEGRLILTDNWYACRYRYRGDNDVAWRGVWSELTDPTLGEGWIKRVLGGVGPFAPRDNGLPSGLSEAETAYASYGDEINSIVNQISQAGERWEGDTPLNCSSVNDHGLIAIYETVLNRGISLSLNANPPYADDDLNQALLLVASRIADLYGLLGNEAYADASDPTIGYGTSGGQFGRAEASSIFCFQGHPQVTSLIDEELALLRGLHDGDDLPFQNQPAYNRLRWNFFSDIVGGEVAYALNYDIRDANGDQDGEINPPDAAALYPQGHGDAWGHYLTALKTYYRLLRHPEYEWKARAESINVAGEDLLVDYRDEEKFAATAAAKARTGAEIVNLTYRENYLEDPQEQFQGYRDTDEERAWGLAEWGSRAGQGAYFDWVVGNAILPAESDQDGLEKIDRTTIPELREITARYEEIQSQVDAADRGLNPLGVARNAVPFDINPGSSIDDFTPHYEQIYARAVAAMNTAISAFNFAEESTQNLRALADSRAERNTRIEEQEADFRGRLIEIFGTPYPDDQTYPSDYDGPDIFNYFLVDATELLGEEPGATEEFIITYRDLAVNDDGTINETGTRDVTYELNTSGLVRLPKPAEWTRRREAPGEIQFALSDLFQNIGRFQGALLQYNDLLQQIEEQAEQIQAQQNLNQTEIDILNEGLNTQQSLNDAIARSRARQLDFRTQGRVAVLVANAMAEFLPTSVGFSVDATAPARGAIRLAGTVTSEVMTQNADDESLAELDHQQAQSLAQAQQNIRIREIQGEFAVNQQLLQLEQFLRREAQLRLEIYGTQEAMQQTMGRYMATVARGTRLLEDRLRFVRRTTGEINELRYRDMAFRIFRNDALQKYRAQYNLAATYVYLAAKAYDYETNLLRSDTNAGQQFLSQIVSARTIGEIGSDGQPRLGSGLADAMRQMQVAYENLNFDEVPYGVEDFRLSLRKSLFRIKEGSEGQEVWKEALRRSVVGDINALPEFKRYAIPIPGLPASEPGIVIRFSTAITRGQNFFGWPSDVGGEPSLGSSTYFAVKLRGVGVWLSNYDNNTDGLETTPRGYLIPVGEDLMRSPTDPNQIRSWRVVDQVISDPTLTRSVITDDDYIPRTSLSETFGDRIRRFGTFPIFHDDGFNISQVQRNTRLIGRSAWNTEWLLIIPGVSLLGDNPEEGLRRFIEGRDGVGVTDIRLLLDVYGAEATNFKK